MNTTPLVSIITPAYNHERFIGQCVESVLVQSFQNWEQIIIDDGSTDATGRIVKNYKDRRIRYFRQERVGIFRLAETYNKGLSLAKGELIAILEGDDSWPADKLAKQIEAFENENVVLAWGKGLMIDKEGKIIGAVVIPRLSQAILENRPVGMALRKLLWGNFIVPAATVMVRKRALASIGGFKQPPFTLCADYLTWLELTLEGEFLFIDTILGYWRRHSSQQSSWRRHSSQSSMKHRAEHLLSCAQVLDQFLNELPIEIKNNLGLNETVIKARNHWSCGRAELLNREWHLARKYFIQAILRGSGSLRLKAIIGLAASYLKIDLKGLTAVADKNSIWRSKLRKLARGSELV